MTTAVLSSPLRNAIIALSLVAASAATAAQPPKKATGPVPIAPQVTIGKLSIRTDAPPQGLALREKLGLVCHATIDGQLIHETAREGIFEAHCAITPGGNFLLMFPEGQHYGSSKGKKVNDMMACRSSDKGKTWSKPAVIFNIDYNQHGFVPLIPRGTKRLYAFGTQPIPGRWTWEKGLAENAPIGFRWSDDDGRTWSDVQLIDPVNDPTFTGMSVMRMCETDAGTWLIGSHEGDWSIKPLRTRQYILRSEDRGKTWALLPDKRPNGWFAEGFDRMDEGRLISLGKGKVLIMLRTPAGRLFIARSEDDGKTWSKPQPTSLVHPDAPPMLFHLADGKTLAAFHHNRTSKYDTLSERTEMQKDRAEIWVATSTDEGRTWSEPRFLFVNALAPTLPNAWYNYQCSYLDVVVDGGVLHLFVPHRWKRVLHLTLREADLAKLPTKAELSKSPLPPGEG